MASSTSSSNQTERKVVLTVVAVLAAWELTAQAIAPMLDYDRAHIHRIPALVAELNSRPAPRVLFFGNSLTMWGVDTDVVADELTRRGAAKASMATIRPVGTAVADWTRLYQTRLAGGAARTIVVVGFVAHHACDVPPVKIRRRARHFCDRSALAEMIVDDLDGFGDRAEAALSFALASFGDQVLHQERVLSCLLPGYREGVRRVNRVLEETAAEAPASASGKRTYRDLARLAAMLKADGVEGVFVAMPLPEMWELDDAVRRTVEDAGMTFIDARRIEGLTEADFRDGYHLGSTGAERYSRFLARVLAQRLTGDYSSTKD